MSDSKAALLREIKRLEDERRSDRHLLVELCRELADHAGEDPSAFWPGSAVEPPSWYWYWVA